MAKKTEETEKPFDVKELASEMNIPRDLVDFVIIRMYDEEQTRKAFADFTDGYFTDGRCGWGSK